MCAALLVMGASSTAFGQMQVQRIDDPPRVAAFWELGGPALFSANIDVMATDHTSVRAGGLALFLTDDTDAPWSGLAMVNRLFGRDGHYLETGIGVVAMHRFTDVRATAVGATAAIGYRVQTRKQFGRIGLSAPPPRPDGRRSRPVMAISYGRTFF
jgi:hypothetical protein